MTGSAPVPGSAAGAAPVLRVVSGTATDEEVAALVAMLMSGGSPAPEPPEGGTEPGTGSGWAARDRAVRRPLHPGPGAWRRSVRG